MATLALTKVSLPPYKQNESRTPKRLSHEQTMEH